MIKQALDVQKYFILFLAFPKPAPHLWDMEAKQSTRKPYNQNVGYVCSLKCKLGGYVVIYDRNKGFEIDSDYRWVVMHEPSSLHISVTNLPQARDIMKGVARAFSISEAQEYADILPTLDNTPSL